MDNKTRRSLILDAIKPMEAVRLSGELQGLAERLTKETLTPMQRVKIAARVREISTLLSGDDGKAILEKGEQENREGGYGYQFAGYQDARGFWTGEKLVWLSESKYAQLKEKLAAFS